MRNLSDMSDKLHVKKHIKYLERHLALLPSKYQEHEPNKLAIICYALVGQACLGVDVPKKYEKSKSWLETHYREFNLNGDLVSGFVSCPTMDLTAVPTINLPNTLFALYNMICLDNYEFLFEGIDRDSICRFVSKCQIPGRGTFVSCLDSMGNSIRSPTDSSDLRYCYIAVAILNLMGCQTTVQMRKYIDVDNLLEFIKSHCCMTGGFGQYGEAHAGYTSCALSILDIMGDCWQILSPDFVSRTIEWLVMRQVSNQGCMKLMVNNENYDLADNGGFQGRENKFADTCYVFWCLNSLEILNRFTKLGTTYHIDALNYLLENTQNDVIGGFAKNDEDDPDPYHTCLGIAAISLINGNFNGPMFLPTTLLYKYRTHYVQ